MTQFLNFSDQGAKFVFGETFQDHFIAFKVLPTIIFFSSFISIREVGKLACIYKEAVAFHFYLYPIHERAVGVKVYKCDFVASCFASIRLSAYVKNWKLLIEVVHWFDWVYRVKRLRVGEPRPSCWLEVCNEHSLGWLVYMMNP